MSTEDEMAFPGTTEKKVAGIYGAIEQTTHPGMTLRDYFAAKTLQGLVANAENWSDDRLVSYCYEVADAMLEERAMETIKALSIRQPWAWMILHAGKDVENRSWVTHHRGPVLIHAAKGCTGAEYRNAIWTHGNLTTRSIYPTSPEGAIVTVPELPDLPRGGIVGVAEIMDCVKESESPWFYGPCGFVLRNVRPVPFAPCKGALGFFRPQLTQMQWEAIETVVGKR